MNAKKIVNKQSTQWFATYNNVDTTIARDYLEKWHTQHKATYVVGQVEKGEEGTVHLQFVVILPKQRQTTLTGMKKKCSKAHFEIPRNIEASIDYCQKEDTRVEGPWTFGIRPAKRNVKGDVARWNKDVLEVGAVEAVDKGYIKVTDIRKLAQALDLYRMLKFKPFEATDVRGEWHWGVSGAGKSHYAHTTYPDAYIKQQNKWFDGYLGQKVILIEDLDTPTIGHYLKIWADKYACTGETKGGNLNLQHEKLIVTSNFSPAMLFKDQVPFIEPILRRFKIVEYTEKY